MPDTYYSAFVNSNPQNATLHVPDESLDAYRNTSPWSEFGSIVGLSETSINSIESEYAEPYEIFSADGQRRTTTSKGLNIVKMNDGTVKKVIVK